MMLSSAKIKTFFLEILLLPVRLLAGSGSDSSDTSTLTGFGVTAAFLPYDLLLLVFDRSCLPTEAFVDDGCYGSPRHISSGKEGLIESSVLDDVKNNLVSLFLLSHSGINPHVCGTDLDSVSFGNPCLFTSSLLNFFLVHDS
nr:hypothetical protein [Tanacetum cinerariifolium]